jgi:3-oxoacyl-(acyl-carrier-protein) synthase
VSRATTPRDRRVVVTGIGVVSAWGWGAGPFWDGLCSGATVIADFSRIDHRDYRTHVAGEVPAPPAGLGRRFPGWGRHSVADRFALAAAAEALGAAGLAPPLAGGPLTGVFFGSSTGGMLEGEGFYARVRRAEPGRPRVGQLASHPVSSPGEAVARWAGVSGPVETVSSACASATQAIGLALAALRDGEVDLALAGGADSRCRITYGGFNSLRSVDERPCRPFRLGREGLSIGEGAAVLVLEPLAAARARGVEPLAELAGAAATGDAHHMTAPHPEGRGAADALELALADAGLAPSEIAFVNAHGTGTPLNDLAEWRALVRVFGERAGRLPVTSTKGSVGHLLGSAGVAEAAATVLGLVHGAVHPTPGCEPVDPETPVRLVEGDPVPVDGDAAVSLNLAFGGCNAALVFHRRSAA